MPTQIRVRFAPSPTGYLHIGGLRTLLYNWLFAKKHKGKLILRVEDTDKSRIVPGATIGLLKILKEVGLDYDEGPFLRYRSVKLKNKKSKIKNNEEIEKIIEEKGRYGPYIQSKRLEIYRKYAQELIKRGQAYYCFCTSQRLEEMRRQQMARNEAPRYDGKCRELTKDEINQKLKNKTPYVIRLKVPKSGETKFYDLIRQEVSFENKNIDDQILLKSDGWPTYHLANVVDDYLMEITHVIRGEEWLPSTPKHILLYKAFEWRPPKFAHLPLLLNPDKSKLSKRQGDVVVEDYLAKGYLPEALINFIALLGWNPDTDEEIFLLKKLIKRFSLHGIQKTGAIFNIEKLDWMNGYYIRQMELGELTKKCVPFLIQSGLIKSLNSKSKFQISKTGEIIDFGWLKRVIALEQERIKKLSEIGELTEFFFKEKLEYDSDLLRWKKMTNEEMVKSLSLVKQKLKSLNEIQFNKEEIEKVLKDSIKKEGIGVGEMLWPLRVALTGRKASPGPFEVAEVLGKEEVLKRIKQAKARLKNL